MSTLTPPQVRPSSAAAPSEPVGLPVDQMIVLEDVSWRYYEQTYVEFEERHLRVTYDQGRMEIMTTGNLHEITKTIIGRLLEMYAFEMDIPITGYGSVTCQRKDLEKGLDPDECYYVQTPPPPIRRGPLDLTIDPSPDLAIEIDVTNSSIPRQPIYAAMGVQEIWRFDGKNLASLHRQPDGAYQLAEFSLAFPSLSMVEFGRFLKIALEESQHAAAKALVQWIRSNG